MGCNCGKKGKINTRSIVPSANRFSTLRTNSATPSQLQALANKAAEQAGNPTNEFERRRVEKLRRDAIKKALGR